MVKEDGMAQDIRSLLVSELQRSIRKKVFSGTVFRVSEELYDAEIEYTASILRAAHLSANEVEQVLLSEESCLIAFCREYMKAQPILDQGQEYNPDEPPEEEEPDNEQYSGHSQTCLLQYATLYLMLRRKVVDLLLYLKNIREPHASKQATRLHRFFSDFSRRNPHC